jgi:hypothetical protein
LTRDLPPVPFPGIATNNLTNTYVRCGEKGVAMGPDGKVYSCIMYDEGKFFVTGWNPEGLPLEGKYLNREDREVGARAAFSGEAARQAQDPLGPHQPARQPQRRWHPRGPER